MCGNEVRLSFPHTSPLFIYYRAGRKERKSLSIKIVLSDFRKERCQFLDNRLEIAFSLFRGSFLGVPHSTIHRSLIPMAGRPCHFLIQRSDGKRTGSSVTGLSKVHQFGDSTSWQKFPIRGMIVYVGLKIAFGGNDAEPIGCHNQEVGISNGKIANHPFEVVPAMSAEDHHFAYALNIKRSYNVLQNGLLGGITGVNTKRSSRCPGLCAPKGTGGITMQRTPERSNASVAASTAISCGRIQSVR